MVLISVRYPPLFYLALLRKSWKSQRHSNKASLPKVTPMYHTLRLHHTLQILSRSKKLSSLYQIRKFSKCTMQLLHNLSTKPRKSNILLKDLLKNRPSSRYPTTLLKTLWVMLAPIYSKSTPCWRISNHWCVWNSSVLVLVESPLLLTMYQTLVTFLS